MPEPATQQKPFSLDGRFWVIANDEASKPSVV